MEKVLEIKEKYQNELLKIPGVVGVGVGKHNDNFVIRILVSKEDEKLLEKLPESLEGIEVNVKFVGEITEH